MSFMGIDVGTSGVKAIAFTPEGKVLTKASEKYELIYGSDQSISLNPSEVWNAIKKVISKVASETKRDPIKTLAVSALGEAVTPVDAKGNFLDNTLVAFDTRATEEASYLGRKLGNDEIYAKTGHSLHPMYSIHKIAFWKRTKPELYQSAYKFLCWQDMVAFKLGVDAVIDYSLASRTQAFNISELNWDSDILNAYDIDIKKLPETCQAGSSIGVISPRVADELGLPSNTAVVVGGFDQACAALGSGVSTSNKATLGLGTVECLTVAMDKPFLNDVMLTSNLPCIPYVVPGMYCSIAYNFSGGSLIKWFIDNFANQELSDATRENKSVFDVLLGEIAETADGILVLPHFMGSGTPYMDPKSKGAILGLTLKSTKSQVFRAIVEGITFEMRLNLKLLSEAGITVDELIATGGGAQSKTLLQIKADILERPVSTISTIEAGCLGCSLLASVAQGEFDSFEDAIGNCVSIIDVFKSDYKEKPYYDKTYEKYAQLYTTLKQLI